MEKKRKTEKSGLKNGDFGQNGSKTAQNWKKYPRIFNAKSAHLTFEIPPETPISESQIQGVDVMLQSISSPRREAASSPHPRRTTLKKVVTNAALQLQTLPYSYKRCLTVTCDTLKSSWVP
jgi:hypothetical protein